MVARRGVVAAGSLVGRDRGRFRFAERDARLRVQSRSLPVSESHLSLAVFGTGHSAGASSLRRQRGRASKTLLRVTEGNESNCR